MKRLLCFVGILMMLVLAGCGKSEKYEAVMPVGVETADIFVTPVEGISDDFYRGVDISTILAEEKAGAKYYTEAGVEEDVFKILADSGVNYIRVRVWNDPYDENKNGYGGGNCDADTAAEIGKRAAQYGMKLFVDFHYSDFWADPGKQFAPKAWEDLSSDKKAKEAYKFTYKTLKKIIKAGADVGMVQVGNETNNGMSGEKQWSAITKIMASGSEAVRDIAKKYKTDIKVAVHFANPENSDNIRMLANKLFNYGLDYDVFALSYYPYWHGSLDNLKEVMSNIQSTYGKETLVAETSYMFTEEDGDGNANSVSAKDLCEQYGASVQSQAVAVRDVCAAVSEVGGLGVFYWEPAWIPVDKSTWSTLGTGWATKYAAGYDPNDAGKYYGGCAWDNQAMFDFDGKALASLSVWKYLKYGAVSELKTDFVNDVNIEVETHKPLEIPQTVYVYMNDRNQSGEQPVNWNSEDVAKCDTETPGVYFINGTISDGTPVQLTVKVAGVNLVKNPSFEEEDRSMWEFIYEGGSVLDFQKKEGDAFTGEYSLHYWRQSEVSFKAQTTVTGLPNGIYTVGCVAQGGDSGANPKMFLYAETGGKTFTQDYSVNGWINWQEPQIKDIEVTDGTLTLGVSVDAGKGAWGTFDDFYIYRQD